MQAETAVFNILTNTSGVTTLVGGPSDIRIYYGRLRQTKPTAAITIEPAGINPTDQKPDATGSGQGVSKLDVEDVLVFSYGGNHAEANTLAQAVRAALDKKSGGTYGGVVVQSVQFTSEDYFVENTDPATYVYEHSYRVRVIR